MTLLVVPLAADESDMLTLGEFDALRSRAQVLFEQPDHPLAVRLEDSGTSCGPLDGDPDPGRSDLAVVCDPTSQLVLDLARQGAEVIIGPASSPDALSAAHAAPTARRSGSALITLAVIMARLRSDDGCPWDREQTHESLKVHLIEEAHEVIDAIERGELGDELEEELGDLLLQIAFHARVAAQDDRFDLADVAKRITAKLLHRHPHVFGETVVESAHEVVR